MNSQRFDEETLNRNLALLAEETSSLNAPPEVEQKLLEAFRARRVSAPTYGRYWLVAAAAMILIVIGVVALRSQTDNPKPEFARQTEQPPIKEQPIVEEPKVDQPQPAPQQFVAERPRRRSIRRAPRSEVANHMNREIATDFMPLGYLNPATLQDGGQIIRVEVPRSALVNFGLPVNPDRYHEKVKADVLFGVDGMAHAIRFVKNQ